jgi:hypothetical protein
MRHGRDGSRAPGNAKFCEPRRGQPNHPWAHRDHPGPGVPRAAPSNSFALAAFKRSIRDHLAFAILCGVALKRAGPSGKSHWSEAFHGTRRRSHIEWIATDNMVR